jgi:hypothetical protein
VPAARHRRRAGYRHGPVGARYRGPVSGLLGCPIPVRRAALQGCDAVSDRDAPGSSRSPT